MERYFKLNYTPKLDNAGGGNSGGGSDAEIKQEGSTMRVTIGRQEESEYMKRLHSGIQIRDNAGKSSNDSYNGGFLGKRFRR